MTGLTMIYIIHCWCCQFKR